MKTDAKPQFTARYFSGSACTGSAEFQTKEEAVAWAEGWIDRLGRNSATAVVGKKGDRTGKHTVALGAGN